MTEPWVSVEQLASHLACSVGSIYRWLPLRYVRYISDFPAYEITNLWTDTAGSAGKIYVVQTSSSVVQRCILMSTDPGDLVLDPTCGSGTTATVAEQWGRRWITVDTSRVALALARSRIMGARYPFYLLADSREGQQMEADITRTAPSAKPVHGNIRHGFVYERIPHITLKAIANNTEIDVIWEKWQEKLEPLRGKLNAAAKQKWQEWEIPHEADPKWSEAAKKLHAGWWQARIARQQEIDKSIAGKAEFECITILLRPPSRAGGATGPTTRSEGGESPDHISASTPLGSARKDTVVRLVVRAGVAYLSALQG